MSKPTQPYCLCYSGVFNNFIKFFLVNIPQFSFSLSYTGRIIHLYTFLSKMYKNVLILSARI
jgi:hypothetical protein